MKKFILYLILLNIIAIVKPVISQTIINLDPPVGRALFADSCGGGGSIGNADSLGGQLPAYYLNRTNHTGVQGITTVSGLQDSLNSFYTKAETDTLFKDYSKTGQDTNYIKTVGSDTIWGSLAVVGELDYLLKYGNMYNTAPVTINITTQNIYYKLTNGTNTFFNTKISSGITLQGDTARIQSVGLYSIKIQISFEIDNDRTMAVGIFKNNVLQQVPMANVGKGGGRYVELSLELLVNCLVNDNISVKVANISNNANPTIHYGLFTIKKIKGGI